MRPIDLKKRTINIYSSKQSVVYIGYKVGWKARKYRFLKALGSQYEEVAWSLKGLNRLEVVKYKKRSLK